MSDRVQAAMSKTSSAPDPLIGRVINERFKISALIARGGMGKVYRAEQAPLGRVCAVKVLNSNYAGEQDPEFHKRFFLEASIASKLTHPNTVTIFDYGRTDDDIFYMAMEYLEGHTLHRAIREASCFQEDRAAHIARQICRALREAHSLGVIHRDLKPANIFLVEHGDETDFVKVLDFGLVKDVSEGTPAEELTQTGLFMGSPKYMAPEQIRGDRVDARTDIYSLGIILYEMLAGKVPFDRPSSVNILMAHVHDEPPPLRSINPNVQVSPELEAAVFRCIAKDPDQRFRSMDEVLAVLKRVAGSNLGATLGATGDYRALGMSGAFAEAVRNTSYPPARSSGALLAAPGLLSSPLAPQQAPSFPAASATLSGAAPARSGASGGYPANLRSTRTLFLGVGIGAFVFGAALLLANLRGPAKDTAPSAAAAAAGAAVKAAPPASPADTTAPAPPATGNTAYASGASPSSGAAKYPPAFARVRLLSDPADASVREDGAEICSTTPCEVTYRGADADPDREHRLSFSKSGFKLEGRVIKVGDTPVTVRMTRAPSFAPAAAAPREKAEKQDKSEEVPKGFKDIPY